MICGSRSYSWASRTKRLRQQALPNTDTINELLEDYLVPVRGTGGSPQRVMDYLLYPATSKRPTALVFKLGRPIIRETASTLESTRS